MTRSRYVWATGKGAALPVVQVGPRVVAKGYYRSDIDHALKLAGHIPAAGDSGREGASQRR
jgi:hypothetical protein